MKVSHQKMVIKGISTAYNYRKGKGPALVCIHGNSLSMTVFRPLWEDPHFESCPMVIYDLPGHGYSSRAENPKETYTISGYAEHLISLVHNLDLKDIVLVGFSLGGHIALKASTAGLAGIKALFLIGTPPINAIEDFPRAFLPQPNGVSLFDKSITPENAEFFASRFTSDRKLHSHISKTILSTHSDTRSVLMKNLSDSTFFSEIEILRSIQCPVSLLYGTTDKIVNTEYVRGLNLNINPQVEIHMMADNEHIPDWSITGEVKQKLSDLVKRIYE